MTELNVARTGLEDVEEALKDVIDPELADRLEEEGYDRYAKGAGAATIAAPAAAQA